VKRIKLAKPVLVLIGALALAGGCSDEPSAGDGSSPDGSVECSADLFCREGVVEREFKGEAGRCLREKVHTCSEGCRLFSATTTQPALLCREGLPPPSDLSTVADQGDGSDALADMIQDADGYSDAAAEASVPVDAAAEASVPVDAAAEASAPVDAATEASAPVDAAAEAA
jgi:hypothetical protein